VKLSDLVTSNTGSGRLSHTKLWSNIAYGVATYAMVRLTNAGTLSAEMLLVYLGAVGASATASKVIAARYAAKATSNDA
jgi:hypothetical protein